MGIYRTRREYLYDFGKGQAIQLQPARRCVPLKWRLISEVSCSYTELVNTFGQDLKQRHGQKIHKLSIHGAFTCPNRDGTLGRGGCTFCNVSSFADESAPAASPWCSNCWPAETEVTRAKRYLAYFQAYTSTYAEVEYLRRMYEEALSVSDMVGLCVGTRPDCVPDAVLDLLAGYQARGYEVWLELGLQSANDKTPATDQPGHGYAAMRMRCGEPICAASRSAPTLSSVCRGGGHGNLETLHRVVETRGGGIKLHPLHVVQGSTFGKGVAGGTAGCAHSGAVCGSGGRHDPAHPQRWSITASASAPPDPVGTRLVREPLDRHDRIAAELARSGPQGQRLGRPFSLPLSNELRALISSKNGGLLDEIQSLQYSFVQVTLIRWWA